MIGPRLISRLRASPDRARSDHAVSNEGVFFIFRCGLSAPTTHLPVHHLRESTVKAILSMMMLALFTLTSAYDDFDNFRFE